MRTLFTHLGNRRLATNFIDITAKSRAIMLLSLKTSKMSRLKQNQIIDSAIQSIASITQSQCSLSEKDLIVLNEALERLQFLKRKKGKTNEQIQQEIVNAVVLLIKFFAKTKIDETKM